MKNVKEYLERGLENKKYLGYFQMSDFCEFDIYENKNRKVLVLHHTDLDGCGIVVLMEILKKIMNKYNGLNFNITYVPCPKEADSGLIDNLDKIDTFTDIIISDLSIKDKRLINKLDRMNNEGTNVVLLDHHESAIEMNKYTWACVLPHDIENNKLYCGTSLSFWFFIPAIKKYMYNEIYLLTYEFMSLVSNWDTWNWKRTNNLGAKRLNNIFKYYGLETFVKTIVENITMRIKLLTDNEITINKVLENTTENICKKAMGNMRLNIKEINGKEYCIGYIITESNVSDICDYIFDNYKDYKLDVIISYNIYFNSFSVRTRNNNINAINIAKQLVGSKDNGFGGHPAASGCSNSDLSNDILNKINDLIRNIDILQ